MRRPLSAHEPMPPAVIALVGTMAAIEGVLQLADAGVIGSPDWRAMAILLGGFWQPVLSGQVAPVWPGQKAAIFLTHAFLHGGLMHVLFNGVILLALGKEIALRAGQGAMLVLFVTSAVAGAATFAALSASNAPMVGASGAVFGFLGVWLVWLGHGRRARGLGLGHVWRMLAVLVAINVILAVAMQGALAWQGHLGGFIVGALAGGPLMTRARRRARAGR